VASASVFAGYFTGLAGWLAVLGEAIDGSFHRFLGTFLLRRRKERTTWEQEAVQTKPCLVLSASSSFSPLGGHSQTFAIIADKSERGCEVPERAFGAGRQKVFLVISACTGLIHKVYS